MAESLEITELHRLLGVVHNEALFQPLAGTPPFSSFISDLSFSSLSPDLPDRELDVWDPFCGNGVILRTISVIHRSRIKKLIASDLREEAAVRVRENLALCSLPELEKHLASVRGSVQMALFGSSHGTEQSLVKLEKFRDFLQSYGCHFLKEVTAFKSDILSHDEDRPIADESVDVVLTDPPYEYMEAYYEGMDGSFKLEDYLPIVLNNIRRYLRASAIVGLILDNNSYSRILGGCQNYELLRVGNVHKRYRKRILYVLRAV